MRVLPFFLVAILGVASALSKNRVRKRFILTLAPKETCGTACVDRVKNAVTSLLFQGKPARCEVVRHNENLRMLTIQCGCVRSDTTAMLLNERMKEIEGVRHSCQDAILTTIPTDSSVHDEGTGSPETAMFQPISREVLPNGFVPYNWGVDRINEESSPLDKLPMDFSCYPNQGKGVRIFVIDTGCRTDHDEFVNIEITTEKAPGSAFHSGKDDHGHGTHIAAVVGGANVGMARKASITCIKAFDKNGNGAATDTIAAVEHVLAEKAKNTSVPFVVNLSYSALTGFTTTPLDEIVYSSSAHGIVFVVSAGNAAVNSCFFSPSKAEQAFTVAASTKRDTLEVDSNIGPCVEFIAPGHEIVSAGIKSPVEYESMNGTSMATPHISGLSALVLAENSHMQSSPDTVRDSLYEILLTRTANVSNFMMPLMHTSCDASQEDVKTRRLKSTAAAVGPVETREPNLDASEDDEDNLLPIESPELMEILSASPPPPSSTPSQALSEQTLTEQRHDLNSAPEKRRTKSRKPKDILLVLINWLRKNS
ncbi:Extracellular serine proteinase [Gracilariopsis chorda]|uniref:Extracellular serine proteinase n=1 Tax=Gracilariopsis chorda TaxID=448386 RepID=A0A2V3ISP3_9FLOR|nr:Extracellular serine proteinase [Gracilariopsis chorda]|eukprot:PXF45122.1 Extracellular serine proteinase [Gracilariopsis chorda]